MRHLQKLLCNPKLFFVTQEDTSLSILVCSFSSPLWFGFYVCNCYIWTLEIVIVQISARLTSIIISDVFQCLLNENDCSSFGVSLGGLSTSKDSTVFICVIRLTTLNMYERTFNVSIFGGGWFRRLYFLERNFPSGWTKTNSQLKLAYDCDCPDSGGLLWNFFTEFRCYKHRMYLGGTSQHRRSIEGIVSIANSCRHSYVCTQ